MFYKITNNYVPDYLYRLSLPAVSEVVPYNLRNATHLRTPRARTSKYANSFLPDTSKAWNSLPDNVKSAYTIASFKTELKRHLFTTQRNQLYSYGSRVVSIFHTRIRLGHSDLKAHLYAHGLSESNACDCGSGQETTKHFLLQCRKYAAPRQELLLSLANVLHFESIEQVLQMCNIIEVILCGSEDFPFEVNAEIFKYVQEFLAKSRRFSLY